MRVGLLGCYIGFDAKNMIFIDFQSKKTILEYDLLIIDLSSIFWNCYEYQALNGNYVIGRSNSDKFLNDFKRRKDEIEKFLNCGKTIIVLNGINNCIYGYFSGNSIQRLRSEPVGLNAIDLLPIKISPVNMEGTMISFKNKKLEENLKKYIDYLKYNATYDNVKDNILMVQKDTNDVLSYYEKVGNGKIVFIPSLNFEDVEHINQNEIEEGFYNVLCNIDKLLDDDNSELPSFSQKYLLPAEKSMIDDICESKKKLKLLEEEIKDKESYLQNYQRSKILFFGTDRPLENIVVEYLRKIGFEISKYDPVGVDEDIVIKYDNNTAVVEIKGVTGSSNEHHTCQVSKWMDEYFMEYDVHPKGILIVNAFRTREFDDRQEYFPNQMLKYAVQREICLLTTIQLYNIALHIEKNPNDKKRIIEEIFKTDGLYKDFDNWQLNIYKNN